MAKFPLPSDLPQDVQPTLASAGSKSSFQRSNKETIVANTYASYIGNEVIATDAAGLIVQAAGNGVPSSGWNGFRKGAIYINKSAADHGTYVNAGNETSTSWKQVQAS